MIALVLSPAGVQELFVRLHLDGDQVTWRRRRNDCMRGIRKPQGVRSRRDSANDPTVLQALLRSHDAPHMTAARPHSETAFLPATAPHPRATRGAWGRGNRRTSSRRELARVGHAPSRALAAWLVTQGASATDANACSVEGDECQGKLHYLKARAGALLLVYDPSKCVRMFEASDLRTLLWRLYGDHAHGQRSLTHC